MPSLQFIVLWCLSLVGLALPPLTEFDLLMLESRQRAAAAGYIAYGLAAETPPAPEPQPQPDAGSAAKPAASAPPAAEVERPPAAKPTKQYYYYQPTAPPRRGWFR